MPWGFTVRFSSNLSTAYEYKFAIDAQGIFELENGGGLFGES